METAGADPTTQQEKAPSQDSKQPRSIKELEKARKKAEKLEKLAEKQRLKATNDAVTAKPPKKKEQSKDETKPKYVSHTPKGRKKSLLPLEDPLCSAYLPEVVESAWYDWWEAEGFFKPELTKDGLIKPEGSFIIAQPPPNVTGALHCGHAMAIALEDTMARWSRMKGLTVLFIPGCDHAGISTQSVVEKMLWRRQQKTRHDLGREKLVDLIWDWKEEYHVKINTVLKRLGGSQDWSREAFTMDENLSMAVAETFCRLHEEGLIYRSDRLVNWCTHLNTALSNLEVVNLELSGRTTLSVPGYDRKVEFGVLTHFKYPIEGSEDTIEVATTRPETMLGDTAIAVHPNDNRYQQFIGRYARHPFVERLLPIVADEYVDPEFGTGAVKITPAHDANDFDIGKRHGLDSVNILNDDGTLNEHAGTFAGQKRFDARYSVTEGLIKLGLFVKKQDNPMKVPLCEKSKDVIEPLIKPQWWMKMQDLASEAISAVRDGKIKIRPESASKNYFHWMENIGDWCLSRQLWWGHRVPAYIVTFTDEHQQNKELTDEVWVVGRDEVEAHQKAVKKFPGRSFSLERDPDVLDTWFSSGLWPFSTLGWPKHTSDLRNFYPTSMLETGWDILFFWVARMIMLGIKLTGEIPFSEVYCHCMVRDTEGRKMSKSLGNVIDPVDVMEGISLQALHDKLLVGNLDPKEIANATRFQQQAFPKGIPECGADALRFCLIQYCTGGDINFDINVMHGYRKFCNKIYQATKYVLGKFAELGKDFDPRPTAGLTGCESLAERWILHKLTATAKAVDLALTERDFSKATQHVYQYWYDDLCDVYIENSKSIIRDGSQKQARSAVDTLYTALEAGLTMLHPFMPFLTEELWQRLPRRPGDNTVSIMLAAYPRYDSKLDDSAAEKTYEAVLGCSKAIRSLSSEYSVGPGAQVYVLAKDEEIARIIVEQEASIIALCGKIKPSLQILLPASDIPLGCAVASVSASLSVLLYVRDHISLKTELEKVGLKARKAAAAAAKQQKVVEASDFSAKTSTAVQQVEQQRLKDLLAQQKDYEQSMEQFRRLVLSEV